MPEMNNVNFTLSFDNSPYSIELCDDVVIVKKNDIVVDICFDEDEITLLVEQNDEELENLTISLEKHVDQPELPQVGISVTTNSNDLEQLVKNAEFERVVTQVAEKEPEKQVVAAYVESKPKSDLQDLIDKEISKITTNILEKLNNKN